MGMVAHTPGTAAGYGAGGGCPATMARARRGRPARRGADSAFMLCARVGARESHSMAPTQATTALTANGRALPPLPAFALSGPDAIKDEEARRARGETDSAFFVFALLLERLLCFSWKRAFGQTENRIAGTVPGGARAGRQEGC